MRIQICWSGVRRVCNFRPANSPPLTPASTPPGSPRDASKCDYDGIQESGIGTRLEAIPASETCPSSVDSVNNCADSSAEDVTDRSRTALGISSSSLDEDLSVKPSLVDEKLERDLNPIAADPIPQQATPGVTLLEKISADTSGIRLSTASKQPAVKVHSDGNKKLDYGHFQKIIDAEEREKRGRSLCVSGRVGYSASSINGMYFEDGRLNGRPRFKKPDQARWLKFNDAGQWMFSRHWDGRALGEAVAVDEAESPDLIHEVWHVCNSEQVWDQDSSIKIVCSDCAGCGVACSKPLQCSVCFKVSYCGRKCQREDWRFHKRNCKPVVKKAAEDARTPTEPEPEHALDTIAADSKERTSKQTEDNASVDSSKQAPSMKQSTTPSCTSDRHASEKSVDKISKPAPLSCWNAAGTWEERNMLPWATEKLSSLLSSDVSDDGQNTSLGACDDDGVHATIIRVEDVDGLASVGVCRGERRCLFDLSFKIVFKASWIGTFGCMATEGSVSVEDFNSELIKDPDMVCGMTFEFAHEAEDPRAGARQTIEVAIAPEQRVAVAKLLGATHHDVLKGRGLMHLVHQRLRQFATEFAIASAH